MSRLLTHLSPFAPDDSGACGVFYELGGITVICDAGGCAGNVCGFDEPRWHEKISALFSAGLRDMDAILGRDEMLIRKLAKITEQIPAAFTAIVGTPVPAVIAADHLALKRMAEKQTGLPCIPVETDGTHSYDFGEMLAYSRLFRTFAKEHLPVRNGKCGVIGATPLNTGLTHADSILAAVRTQGFSDAVCFGLDSGLDTIRNASECAQILVISPSGLKAAEYLHDTFGTPFTVGFPVLPQNVTAQAETMSGRRVLIVHQQFAANALRDCIRNCDVTCGTWFMHDARYEQNGDLYFRSEADFRAAAMQADAVFADPMLRRCVPDYQGEWIDFPHYAVSGSVKW